MAVHGTYVLQLIEKIQIAYKSTVDITLQLNILAIKTINGAPENIKISDNGRYVI